MSTTLHPPRELGIETVIFDLDGTLIDTEPAAARAVEACFGSWGHQVTHEDAVFVTGRTWETAFEFLLGKYPVAQPGDEIRRTVIDRYRLELQQKLDVVAGGAECVRSLAAGGFRIGLVSGSFRREIFWALEQLGVRHHFEVVLGAEDYPRSKPAPDGYLKAFDLMGAQAQRTLIFEDSHPGVTSALAAGAWVTAIAGTNHFAQDTSGAHWRVADLRPVTADWVRALRFP